MTHIDDYCHSTAVTITTVIIEFNLVITPSNLNLGLNRRGTWILSLYFRLNKKIKKQKTTIVKNNKKVTALIEDEMNVGSNITSFVHTYKMT